MAVSRGSRSASHGSAGDDVVYATASMVPAPDPTDTCLWAPGRECSLPRSCYDCLNSALTKGQCMVDPGGRCVALEPIDAATDFRSLGTMAGALYVYTSTNTSYCEPSDATCAACRARTDSSGSYYTRGANGTASDGNATANGQLTPFCIGDNGCVCIAACEAPARDVGITALCATWLETAHARQTGLYVVIMGVATALCAFLFFFSARWVKTTRPPPDDDEPVAVPLYLRRRAAPTLSLSAWHAMRQKLIDEEAARRLSHHTSRRGTTVLDDTTAAGA